jgi:hypothetical protein
MKQMTMTEMSAAFWKHIDNSGGSRVPVVILRLNVLAMVAGGSVPIPSLTPSFYKHWVNDHLRAGGRRYQALVSGM